ncbi:MAG: tail fiber domain-containing protein [Bacteroidia bacterium]
MKKILFILFFLNNTILLSQIKVVNNGNVAVGAITYPNHSLHVWGVSQNFNFDNKEILFRPKDQSGSLFHSTIGSNLGEIKFWHPSWGYNTISRGSCVSNSDERLKREITNLNNSLSIIKQMIPKKFKYIDTIIPGNKFHFGFLAQQINQIVPELVGNNNESDFLTLNYEEIIPFLVGAVKEQALIVDSLKAVIQGTNTGSKTFYSNTTNQDILNQLNELKQKLSYFENNCCSNLVTGNNTFDNNIENINNIKLEDDVQLQNVPNPFENNTTIKYSIPSKLNGYFFIKIYKITGEELMSYKIDKTQKEILIDASQLVNGVYNYALINNNEILKMKQMILSR